MPREETAAILLAAAAVEAIGLIGLAIGLRRSGRTLADLGLRDRAGGLAIGLTIAATYYAAVWRLPLVPAWAFRPSGLKAFALLAAIVAGVFEEVLFRGYLMDLLKRRGASGAVQVLLSSVTFGLAHAAWGFVRGRPSLQGMLGPTAWTTLKSRRALGPVIVSHVLIDAVIEPGLLLSAL